MKDLKEFSNNYLNILKNDLAGLNLTRIINEEEFYNKQILDSILPMEKSKVFSDLVTDKKRKIIDVGFGGGFPLVPLAYINIDNQFIGIESKNKKINAVKLILAKLKIGNVILLHERLENLIIDRPSLVTFKAVGKIADLLSKINCAHKDITVYFYKGPELENKENLASNIPKEWELFDDVQYQLPSLENRRLIGFKLKNVPRRTRNHNSLVKVSELPVN